MKKILISTTPWRKRVAVVRDTSQDILLQDIYFDSTHKNDIERCFFKGRISKILPGIQTAFVDIKQQRSGFLHITEVDRNLAAQRIAEQSGEHMDTQRVKQRMDIGKVFKEGEEVLVQVLKEPISEKGAKLTTCFTLPGRFVVLMPNISQIGVSKKIEDRAERTRLKEISQKNLPKGMGAIMRTTAEGKTESVLKRDIAFQIATWKSIKRKFRKAKPGDMIHKDLALCLRVVRDHLDEDVHMVLVDDKTELSSVYKFTKSFAPSHKNKIQHYTDSVPLFDRYTIDKQINQALDSKVPLKSGGSLVIESTEAMTVIDVNTGKFTGAGGSMEDTILKTNLEAADEIVTQLRLRNIGGLIVIDFIDLTSHSNRHRLWRFFEKTLKERDKFQSVALKVSEFGIIQMTRKRSGKTLVQQMTQECITCNGTGFIKSVPTMSFTVLDQFTQTIRRRNLKGTLCLSVNTEVFDYLVNREYESLLALEKQHGSRIVLECNKNLEPGKFSVTTTI